MTTLATIEEILAEAKAGRMFILVDDEDRENEGDLVIPAQLADADAVNFMAMHGRGLICLALEANRVEELQLPLMAQHNASRHQTAFTVSIEAREGVSTGISAPDRAHTIATAIDPQTTASDIVSPGHIFPLVAREGGVLVRAGHTEAAVDIARMAGMMPAGVICEIMNDDGTMAHLPELLIFAEKHHLKIATIADLIAYRLANDALVTRSYTTSFHSRYGGDFTLHIYTNTVEDIEHIVLVKGDITTDEPIAVRMHALNIFKDMLGGDAERGGELEAAMRLIGQEGRGVIVLLREAQRTRLQDRLSPPKTESKQTNPLREYGIGAQILLDLGVRNMILLTNSKRSIVALEGYQLNVVDHRPLTPVV